MAFLMPIQIKYLFTRFASKETKFSNSVHMMSWKWLFIGWICHIICMRNRQMQQGLENKKKRPTQV
jgi:hypothetical protein